MNPDSLTWWNSLRHAGLLLDRKRLQALFPEPTPVLKTATLETLRETLELGRSRFSSERDAVDFVLSEVCGLRESWKRGPQVEASWSRKDRDGQSLRPDRLWFGPHGMVLPVFFDKDSRTLGLGRGRRMVSRVLRWLRSGSEKLAVLTNARQWRILYAGADYEAWCESESSLWFEDGQPCSALLALAQLLSPRVLSPAKSGGRSPLLLAIEDSRKGQADLSSALGERVRLSVERLIDAHQLAIDQLGADLPPADLYRAAVRLIMRLVVVLFAEARGLLPVDNVVYHSSYGLRGLQDDLHRLARSQRLHAARSAWPRLLALFRLVHGGAGHPDIPVRGYGGELFEPGVRDSTDPLSRAVWLFENACFLEERHGVPDALIATLLENLTQTRERVRSGSGTLSVPVPVDFSDLSSEYIGILYEGMLDYELKQVPHGDVAVLLPIGEQPVLPLSRLETMGDKQLAELIKEFSKKKTSVSEEGETEEDSPQDDPASDEADGLTETESDAFDLEQEQDLARVAEAPPGPFLAQDLSALDGLQHRVDAFFAKFVKLAGLVPAHRGRRTPEREAAHTLEVARKASALARAAHYPGKRYLVRWGGTRKGSGSFYTRPGLASPTTLRTLAPLAYLPPASSDADTRDVPLSEWTPRKPEEILALKVCDPACGSGTFPVSALRFLSQALWDSLHAHGRISYTGDNRTAVSLFGKTAQDESLADEFLPCLPEDDTYEPRLRARLKRHVAERCIYGVDLDPLAVELCRLALWIETLDPDLPFTFLNHKIKCGNGLVGCWFDRFEDFPALALHRPQDDAGDGKQGPLSEALKKVRDETIKPSLKRWIESQDPGVFAFLRSGPSMEEQFAEASRRFEQLHAFAIHESEERAAFYHAQVEPAIAPLRAAFDAWCAVWFWPLDRLECLPTPESFAQLSTDARDAIAQTRARIRFFHWELEFPDVFNSSGAGFHAILGNPPWETLKPSSKEWFSNTDPLYRTYGKQEALRRQRELFASDAGLEREWWQYCSQFKSLSNWCAHAGFPWGDPEDEPAGGTRWMPRGGANFEAHANWRKIRTKRRGYSDPAHPFRHQGSADLNTYKLFLEAMHALLRPAGRLGVIVPSNVYTDKGTAALRALFLDQCRWEWLFGFENREKIFDIDSRFKFCPLIVEKGGRTRAIRTAFMRRDLNDWAEAEKFALEYPREQVDRFSPKSRAILELRSKRDAEILEKMYANGVLLGDDSDQGWGLKYATEFHMTNDSKLFPPRPDWEEQGYVPDEYGHWLKGGWVSVTDSEGAEDWVTGGDKWITEHWRRARSILQRPEGLILSRDGRQAIRVEDVQDVALPLYEGRMIDQFDFSAKGWVSGKGRSAVWRDIPWEHKVVEPQYLMGKTTLADHFKANLGPKISYMRVGSATNKRTCIATYLEYLPAGDSVFFYVPSANFRNTAVLISGVLSSLAFDFQIRNRVGGLNLSDFIMQETVLPKKQSIEKIKVLLINIAINLGLSDNQWANIWDKCFDSIRRTHFAKSKTLTRQERLRLMCIFDSLVFFVYGSSLSGIAAILSDCDHPAAVMRSEEFCRGLDPKGFWRVDKELDPELRHTVLAQIAFADLERMGLEAFLSQNDGEGWMLPETLRLADYGLGHDARAQQPQPVASRLGPRFYDWQLEGTVEESWEECRRHADLIQRIRQE